MVNSLDTDIMKLIIKKHYFRDAVDDYIDKSNLMNELDHKIK